MKCRLRVLLAHILVFAATAPVYAASVSPGTTYDATWSLTSDMMMANEMMPFTDTRTTEVNGDGTFSDVNVAGNMTMDSLWGAMWDWTGNSDPFVTNNFTVTNMAGTTQTFFITSTIGVVPIGPASLTSGTVAGTLTDNNSNTATISDTGNAIYTALIDGNSYQTLLGPTPTFSQITSAGGFKVFGADFGLPPNSQPGPAISSDIGIRMEFTLTPGDSVSFTSRFEVEAVPIPAAVWLFGSGLLGLAGIARRKKTA